MKLSIIKRKVNTMLHTPRIFMKKFQSSPIFKYLPDEVALKIIYKNAFNKKLDLQNPKTMNEKLQWLKLYNRKPEFSLMVDKCEAKKYVASIIGEEYIIPTYGVWEHFDDIDFESLPEQFVLKCTHGSGDVVICKDKSQFNASTAKVKLEKSLKTDYYKISREWPYKNVKPRIIAEKYLEDNSGGLTDYKVYCFNGKAKMMLIASDRFTEKQAKFDFFDKDFNWLDFTWGNPRSEEKPEKPFLFDELFSLAEVLSKDLPHIRVDFYVVNSQIYSGELTFFDGGGFDSIEPYEWNIRIGSWLKLPDTKNY